MENDNTPLWLEIKTEYIDANLDNVINYLSKCSVDEAVQDKFYFETIRLLKSRVRELIDSQCQLGLEDEDSIGKEERIALLRILGAFLLVSGKTMDAEAGIEKVNVREVFFFFVEILVSVVSAKFADDLFEIAMKCLVRKSVEAYGFAFSHLKEFQPEVVACLLKDNVRFSKEAAVDSWYQKKGSLRIKDGFIELYSVDREEAIYSKTASSLSLFDETVMVQSLPSDRIREKDADDIEVMESFTSSYVKELESRPSEELVLLKKYVPGDVLPVKFIGKDRLTNLMVVSVDNGYEPLKGQIQYKSQVYKGIYTIEQIALHLKNGDVFDAVYEGVINGKCIFSIGSTFLKALTECTVRVGSSVNAELKTIKPNGLMIWWTADGYNAYVNPEKNDGTYTVGDLAYLTITGCQANGYVYADIEEPSQEPVDEVSAREYCIEGMLYEEGCVFNSAPEIEVLSDAFVKGFCKLLYNYHKSVSLASEKYRILCVCRILSAMSSDSKSLDYFTFMCAYMRNLVMFAMGQFDKLRTLSVPEEIMKVKSFAVRSEIVRILMSYGKDSESDYLSGIIHNPESDTTLVQLAQLVQSCNRIDDVYPAIKNVIKLEITKYLSVNTGDNTDFEEVSGPNLGIENSRQEFKTSFFFAPSNAVQQNQEKNIFRSLCSFLNTSEGGTLYLGVNDCGGINGIEGDLEYLEKKIIGTYKGLDGYIRYITDRAKVYFDLDVRLMFRIEPAFDGRVVVINVDPYPYGIVEMEGVAYIRNNSESVKMSATLRRQIEVRKLALTRDPSKNVLSLSQAIKEEKVVVLCKYASNNDSCSDRHVEPFAFVSGNAYVWCYDLDDGKNKLYRVSRIGNVKVLAEKWDNKDRHCKGRTDIFHFTGDSEIHVRLALDQMAKNLLVEEYPDSVKELLPSDDGRWILDTDVYQIYGLGRFYVGLAEHIEVLDAPELLDYAKTYLDRVIKSI